MNKEEFLTRLREELSGLPEEDARERVTFYGEMIADRMEDGIPEEEAVSELGPIDRLVSQIVAEVPLTRLVKKKITPKRKPKAWEIVLLILGSPVWLPLLIAAFAVLLSIYVVLWSIVLVLWAVFGTVAALSPALVTAGILLCVKGNALTGIASIGAGIACAGLAVLAFFGCKAVTKGLAKLTKKCAVGIKNRMAKKEETK